MDAGRFDRLSKRIAGQRLSRRAALAGGAGGLGTVLMTSLTAAGQEATPAGTPTVSVATAHPSFLFVQTGRAGTFRPMPQPASATPVATGTPVAGRPTAPVRHGQFQLTLTGHAGETVYFSDRPERVFGEVDTERFIAELGFSPANPPNAALVVETLNGSDVLIVELMNPSFDPATTTLTYEANIARQYQGQGLKYQAQQQLDDTIAPEFAHPALFIDDCWNTNIECLTPEGVLTCGPFAFVEVGQCWNWYSLSCYPCQSPADTCNNTFVGPCCQGHPCNCAGWTMDEFDQMCVGSPG